MRRHACFAKPPTRLATFGLGALVILIGCLTASSARAACSNESIRLSQHATFLPECRAFEQVSPVAKDGASVNQADYDTGIGMPPKTSAAAIADDGGAATFVLNGPVEGSEAAPVWNFFTGQRGTNWVSTPIASNQEPWASLPFQSTTLALSRDQSKALTYSELALAPGAVKGNGNYYIRDASTGAYTLLTSMDEPAAAQYAQQKGVWVSNDGTEAIFTQGRALVPGAVEGSGENANLYRWDGQGLHLINTPGEVIAPTFFYDSRQRPVSTNGSRVYFAQRVEGEPSLYLREGSAAPVAIAVSRRPGDPSTPRSVEKFGASADGSVVYFIAKATLLPGLEEESPATTHIYKYEPETDALSAISMPALPGDEYWDPTSGPAGSYNPLAVSADGSTVYFQARRFEEAGQPEVELAVFGARDGEVKRAYELSGWKANEGEWALSLDGTKLLTTTFTPPTEYNNSGSQQNCGRFEIGESSDQTCAEVALFDWDTGEAVCPSCPADGVEPAGHAAIGGRREMTLDQSQTIVPSAVTNAGLAFFDTPQQLVSTDVNGRRDVYAYQDGQLSLLTPGTAPFNAFFHGATPDGSSAMISTEQRLVKQDVDNQVDMYAVRVGGGLAQQMSEPASSPCASGECRGAFPAPPIWTGSGSSQLVAPGNKPAKRVKKKKKACAGKQRPSKHGKQSQGKKRGNKRMNRADRRANACKKGGRR